MCNYIFCDLIEQFDGPVYVEISYQFVFNIVPQIFERVMQNRLEVVSTLKVGGPPVLTIGQHVMVCRSLTECYSHCVIILGTDFIYFLP